MGGHTKIVFSAFFALDLEAEVLSPNAYCVILI